MQAAPPTGSFNSTDPNGSNSPYRNSAVDRRARSRKRHYNRFPKRPLDWKIKEYIRLLDDGWGRNYARAQAGLRCGRKDYDTAMEHPSVLEAHDRNRQAFVDKQRNRWC